MPEKSYDPFGPRLSENVRDLTPSATVSINDLSNRLRRQGREIFKLGLGQSPFPVPESVVQALRENAHQKDYLHVKGLYEARMAVAEHHIRAFGIECTDENVLIGPGSKELMFLLQLCYVGDIIIPAPAWVSYEPQSRIVGRKIHRIATSIENGWFPLPEQLEEMCRKGDCRQRILILNYPSNPTGTTLSQGQLAKLADVCRRNGIVVLSDEIYAKLHFEGTHHSIVPLYPEGTIFSAGLSKWCGAGGWRLGFFIFPERLSWLQEAMASVATETFTSTNAPVQYAAITAFEEGPEIESYLWHSRRILKALSLRLATQIRDAGVDCLDPGGGLYLFPDFSRIADKLQKRGIASSADLCGKLLEETGVAVLPGSEFGQPLEELTMRIAYVDFDGAEALRASEEISLEQPLPDDFVVTHCGRVVEAVDRLCEWVTR